MGLSETRVHQTEQVMQALFHTFFPFPPRYRRVLGNHSLAKFVNTVFVRLTAAACLGMQGKAPSCRFTLQPARLLDREFSFPIPASPGKESHNLSSSALYFWCCFSSFCLQQWSFKSPIFFPNLVFREKKNTLTGRNTSMLWRYKADGKTILFSEFYDSPWLLVRFLLCLNSLW